MIAKRIQATPLYIPVLRDFTTNIKKRLGGLTLSKLNKIQNKIIPVKGMYFVTRNFNSVKNQRNADETISGEPLSKNPHGYAIGYHKIRCIFYHFPGYRE